jgi:hypothetical protein
MAMEDSLAANKPPSGSNWFEVVWAAVLNHFATPFELVHGKWFAFKQKRA